MHSYEHTIIAKQDLSKSQIETLYKKYQNLISKNSGEVLKTQDWGLKNFSHSIKNNKRGYYFHIKFDGVGKTIEELEKAENIDGSIIRYLTVRVKKHDLEKNYFEKKDFEKTSNYEKK